jgi:hypothetical protein
MDRIDLTEIAVHIPGQQHDPGEMALDNLRKDEAHGNLVVKVRSCTHFSHNPRKKKKQ